jgi:hypothetical protein
MCTVEPKKTRTKFTISIKKTKENAARAARFRKELEALLRKYKVKKSR